MTILFTYLFWQSLVCCVIPCRRHNVNAWFVNMVFSVKHKILTKKLYQLKGHNAKQLRTEFPNKGWTPSSINRLLKKFRNTGTVDIRQGSDWPRSAARMKTLTRWTTWFWVKRTSPNSQPVREISRKTGIPKSSVVGIIPKDLQLTCFKRRRAQELTEANCTAGKLLLKVFPVYRGLNLLCRWKGVHSGCSSEKIVKIS